MIFGTFGISPSSESSPEGERREPILQFVMVGRRTTLPSMFSMECVADFDESLDPIMNFFFAKVEIDG